MMTTKLKQIKSYPTYQLHAFSERRKSAVNDIFKICILETMKWLRSRLSEFSEIPEQLRLPEPENYEQLSLEMLQSFSLNVGSNINVIYIESKGIWSFELTETDMGENLGTDKERLPVNGRTFITDISFMINDDCVEMGLRTICSEPSDTTAPCKVFRPAIVKMLSGNKKIGLNYEYEIDGSVVHVSSKSEANRLIDAIQDSKFNIPVVIAAEAPYEQNLQKQVPTLPDLKQMLDEQLSHIRFGADYSNRMTMPEGNGLGDIKIDISHLGYESKIPKEEEKKAADVSENKPEKSTSDEPRSRLEMFDYKRLAEKAMGYAFVCFIEEKCFEYFLSRMELKLECGDVMIIDHNVVIEKYPYSISSADFDVFYKRIKEKVQQLPMRNTVDFGDVIFANDARLLDIKEKKKQNISVEEKCELLSEENKGLKIKIRDMEQKSAANAEATDEIRRLKKSLRESEEKKLTLESKCNSLDEKCRTFSDAFYRSSAIIKFYQEKAAAAAEFPTDISEVSEWAERTLGEYIEIASKAQSELRKYSRSLDVAMLCDGLYFLSGYSKFKRGKIDRDTLVLYSEYAGWEIQGCGKETLKCFKDDYTMNIDGRKMLMDQHIKYGIKAQTLIRIYFCWDENTQKIAIGYMPEHLPTVKNST
ncbi:MAG: hypothetical protein ACI4RH_06440 [Huintestinicola sp.]